MPGTSASSLLGGVLGTRYATVVDLKGRETSGTSGGERRFCLSACCVSVLFATGLLAPLTCVTLAVLSDAHRLCNRCGPQEEDSGRTPTSN